MIGHVSSLVFILDDPDYKSMSIMSRLNGKEKKGEDKLPYRGSGCGSGAATAMENAEDNIGCTPLWTAAAQGHLDTVKYLIGRHGASLNARDMTGTTAA